jgi:hypothetical protein
MSDRPTPETDAWLDEERRNPRISGLGPWLGYCQQLERQRDEAREIARELRDLLQDWRRFWKDNSTKSSSATWSDGQGVLTSTVRLIDKAKEVLG